MQNVSSLWHLKLFFYFKDNHYDTVNVEIMEFQEATKFFEDNNKVNEDQKNNSGSKSFSGFPLLGGS